MQLLDDDEEMDDGVPKVVCCNECLRLKRATLFCTQDCALNNIAKHRLAKHGARDIVADGRSLISPLHEFLDTTLTGQNPGLKFSLVE